MMLRQLSGTFKRSLALARAHSSRCLVSPTPRAERVRWIATVAFDEADTNQQLKSANEWQWQEQQLEAVLKVYSVVSSPSYTLPWQNKPQKETSGSAFVLKGQRIITNAHVVSDHKWVQVRKHGSPTKYTAKVVAVSHDCDLALLGVENEEFWKGMPSLELGDVPELQDEVVLAGYPSGGDNLCVTKGIVSRVEPQQYAHGASHLLTAQVDAAINPGNSGGPALLGGRVAGVAFQAYTSSENVGYVIPSVIMQHFLDNVSRKNDKFGFCTLGVLCQATENMNLRSFLNMQEHHSGVLVNKVRPLSSAYDVLKPNDVLLAIDGHPIGNDGTINWRNRERITFDYLLSLKFAGETARFSVLRDGKEIEPIDVKLKPESLLTPVQQYDIGTPEYFIFGGFVFTPLVQPYLHEWGDDWYNQSPRRLCDLAMNKLIEFEGQQIVVLSQVLSHETNVGYSEMVNLRVHRIGAVEVKNVRHLVELIDQRRRDGCEFVRIELDENRIIAMRIKAADAALPEILKQHRVPADRCIPDRSVEEIARAATTTSPTSSS